VKSILLCWAAWRFSRMFCSSMIACWSSSCLFHCSRYPMFHLVISNWSCKAWMSVSCSLIILLYWASSKSKVVSSSWIITKPNGSPESLSLCLGFLPLSCTYGADVGSEALSTLGGDNTRFATVNKGLVPLWYVMEIGLVSWCSYCWEGSPSCLTSDTLSGALKKSREMKSSQVMPYNPSWWTTKILMRAKW